MRSAHASSCRGAEPCHRPRHFPSSTRPRPPGRRCSIRCRPPCISSPASVAAGGTASSAVIPSDGYQKIALSVTSTEAGTLTLQRYLDASGTVAQGAALQASIAAGQPALVNAVDGLPFQSLTVSVSNSGGTGANLTNLVVLLQGN